VPLGEYPILPTDLIRSLHANAVAARHQMADYLWAKVADGAVTVFESYQCRRS
jgi:hypothetical protein